jgi:hypothetical protein
LDEKKFTIEFAIPKSISILEPSVAGEVLSQLKGEILGAVTPLIEETARRIVAERIGLATGVPVQGQQKSPEEALRELNVSLAHGAITKEEYLKAKSDLAGAQKQSCKKCGKEIEASANFCRFCGGKQ